MKITTVRFPVSSWPSGYETEMGVIVGERGLDYLERSLAAKVIDVHDHARGFRIVRAAMHGRAILGARIVKEET